MKDFPKKGVIAIVLKDVLLLIAIDYVTTTARVNPKLRVNPRPSFIQHLSI